MGKSLPFSQRLLWSEEQSLVLQVPHSSGCDLLRSEILHGQASSSVVRHNSTVIDESEHIGHQTFIFNFLVLGAIISTVCMTARLRGLVEGYFL